MKITKDVCDRLLLANTNNRRVSANRVEAIARAMRNGWFISRNGQTIVVNSSWTWLLDGQHRLLAMRSSGVYDFDITIVEVPDEDAEKAFGTIDNVRGSRTVAQVLSMTTNIPNSAIVSSIISAMIRIVKGDHSHSVSEVLSYYQKYEQIIKKMKVYTECSVGRFRPQTGILAGLLNAILISGEEDELIARFHRILANKCESVCDNLLLNVIVSSRGKGGGSIVVEEFFKTTKAMLNPGLKILKMVENEDLSVWKARNF